MRSGGLRELVAERVGESGGGGGAFRWAGCLEACLLPGCEVARLCCVAAWGGDAEGLGFLVSFESLELGRGPIDGVGMNLGDVCVADGGSRCFAYGSDSR